MAKRDVVDRLLKWRKAVKEYFALDDSEQFGVNLIHDLKDAADEITRLRAELEGERIEGRAILDGTDSGIREFCFYDKSDTRWPGDIPATLILHQAPEKEPDDEV